MSTPSTAARLWIAQKGMCFHCLQPMNLTPATANRHQPLSWSREHLVPQSKGGRGGTNIVLAHFKCNTDRGNADPTEEMFKRAKQIWSRASQLTWQDVKHIELNAEWRFGTQDKPRLYPDINEPKFIPQRRD